MKIVFLSRFQNQINRGAENFVLELSKRLSKNHQADIFTGNDADSLKKVLDGNYDIVVPINGRFQSLKVSLARIFGNYKLLITGHSGIGMDDVWNTAVVQPDVFVALTEYTANWVRGWAWGSKVVKIPNGVDIEKFRVSGEKIDFGLQKPIVLSVGALTWYKHHEKLISAMSRIDKGSLLIVGTGEKKDELEAMGRKLLRDRFKIMSFRYEDMPKVYRSCDLFSLPSWDREAFGIAYLEALSSGLGVVAPDDSVRREIIDGGGLFTRVSDPEEYAKTIEKALDFDWSTKARAQAEKFSWDKVAKKYEELMLSLIKQSE